MQVSSIVQDGEFSWAVNSHGHFLMVITNVATAGGAGAKSLLGSVNTVQCQVRVHRGQKGPSNTFSKNISSKRVSHSFYRLKLAKDLKFYA